MWLLSALIAGVPVLAVAQAENYSLDTYAEMQAEADASYDALSETPGGMAAEAATELAIEDRLALVRYLSAWIQSGTMPDEMVESAEETRAVLYQNIVQMQADIGRCDDARDVLVVVERMAEETPSQLTQDAEAYAWAAIGQCEEALTPPYATGTPDGVTEERERPADGRHASAVPWVVMGTGIALAVGGAAVAYGPMAREIDTVETWNRGELGAGELQTAQDAESRAASLNSLASGLLISGTALVAGGVYFGLRNTRPRPRTQVSVIPALDGPHVMITGRW